MGFIREIRRDIEQEALCLMREYRLLLFAEAKQLTNDDSVAEDLVMKTIESYLAQPDEGLPAKGKVRAWLRTTLRNHFNNSVRGKARACTVYLDEEDAARIDEIAPADNSSDEAILAHSDAELVRNVLARLPKSARSVIVMHYFESLTIRQIAELLRKSPDSVKSNLYYARKVLAKRLGKMMGRAALAIAALIFGGSLLYAAAVATGLAPSPFAAPEPAPEPAAEQPLEALGPLESLEDPAPLPETNEAPQQAELTTTNSETNNEETTMNSSTNSLVEANTTVASAVRSAAVKMLAAGAMLAAASAHATTWTYDSATRTVTDGNWVIKATYTPGGGSITLSDVTTAASDGILDLREMTVDGAPVTSVSFPSNPAYATSWRDHTFYIREFYMDAFHDGAGTLFCANPTIENVEITGGDIEAIDSSFKDMTALTNVVLRLPNIRKIGGNNNYTGFSGCTSLKRIVLDCPNLVEFGKNVYYDCSALEGDISDYIPNTITNFATTGQVNIPGVTGRLVLKGLKSTAGFMNFSGVSAASITFAGTSLANSAFFRSHTALKSFELIAPECTNLVFNSSYCWINPPSFTNVVFYLPKVEAASQWRLSNADVWFQSKAPALSVVQTICGDMPWNRGASGYRTIYCSKRMGWKALADDMTDAEEEVAPEGCFGVLVDSDNHRRAWFVHRDSPYERFTGTAYYLR